MIDRKQRARLTDCQDSFCDSCIHSGFRKKDHYLKKHLERIASLPDVLCWQSCAV